MEYTERLRQIREEWNLSYAEVGHVIHRSAEEYEQMERGEIDMFAEELLLLKWYYRVSADYLMGISDRR